MAKIEQTIQFKESVSETIKGVSINYAKILEKKEEIIDLLKENAELMRKCLSKENIETK